MFRYVILSFTLFLACSAPSLAQDMRGTPQEQAACRSDVRKLCRAVKPGSGSEAMLACLQAHREQLSRACAQVLANHGQ
jgi:hypothetical protein